MSARGVARGAPDDSARAHREEAYEDVANALKDYGKWRTAGWEINDDRRPKEAARLSKKKLIGVSDVVEVYGKNCEHGSPKRQCDRCDFLAELDALKDHTPQQIQAADALAKAARAALGWMEQTMDGFSIPANAKARTGLLNPLKKALAAYKEARALE